MADKTPVRVVFNSSNVATGMAEFQSGESVPVANGGTGLTALGSAGQVLKVNGAGSGLEFGAEGDISITNLVAPTNADLTFSTSGTGNIILDALTLNGTTFSASDSTKITLAEAVDITGALIAGTSITIAGDGATVTGIKDEDDMSSNSDTKLATQQSIKAYVDAEDANIASDTLTFTNKTIDANGTGNNISNIDIGNMTAAVVVLESEGISSNDNDTTLPTSAAVKDYADTKAVLTGSTDNQITTVTGAHAIQGESNLTFDGATLAVTGAVTISGDLTVSGDTTTVSTTNTTIADNLLELNTGISQSFNDAGIIIERGSTGDNAAIIWDESADVFVLGTTTATAANKSGGITITAGTLKIASLQADGVTITDNVITSNDSNADLEINANGSGTVVLENLKVGTSGSTVTTILDEDNLGTDSDTALATQQSIKAYVDTQDANIASDTLTLTNKTFDVEGTGNSISNIDVGDLKSGVLDTDLSSVSGSDDTLASAKAIKSYVDSQVTAQDLDFATDDSTALSIDLDSESLQVSGGANISTSGSGNTITIALDTALTGLSSVTSTALVTNSISSSDSTAVRIDDALNVDGALDVGSGFTISNTTSITSIVDEDAMGSDSATALATQQSIKAYVDTQDAAIASDTLTLTNKTFDVEGTGNSISNIDVADFKATAIVIESEGIGSNDNDTTLPTSAAVKDYVDTQITAEDLDITADDSTAISIDLDSETLHFAGGNGITTSVSGNTVTSAIDSTVATLTGSQTLTNKVLTSPTITTPTVNGTLTATSVTTNDIVSNGSNADINITPTGTGGVVITSGGVALTLPTADGTDGQALVTDGSGTLSFGTVGDPDASDDTNASALSNKRITTTARAIDSFGETFQDSVLYYVCTNDHHLDTVNLQKVSLVHNDTAPFINTTGVASGTGAMTTFTTDTSNNVVRLKAASTNAVGGNVSYYKIGLGDNSTAATSGNIIVTQNTDVDSASEAITSFAHADFRGAKLFISVNNDSKTEVTNMEGLVVHDGTNAFITTYNVVNSGNNTLATFTAAISGDNVVISGAGLEPNLRITVHAIMLKDTMVANAGTYANAEAIAPVTVSSSATSFDTFAQKTTNGAVYFLVSKNASEGHFAINEIVVAFGSDNITHASAGFVSTKGTNQIAVTSEIKDDTELTGDIKISSTSGGSTTVSAYMIKLHAS